LASKLHKFTQKALSFICRRVIIFKRGQLGEQVHIAKLLKGRPQLRHVQRLIAVKMFSFL